MKDHMSKHLVMCLAVAAVGVVLIAVLGFNVALVSLAGGLACIAMMGTMIWMMVRGMGHGRS
jgi:hypothetical protein